MRKEQQKREKEVKDTTEYLKSVHYFEGRIKGLY